MTTDQFDAGTLARFNQKSAAATGATVAAAPPPAVDFDEALRRLEELGNAALRRKSEFAEWLGTQPTTSTCPKHGTAVERDFDASWLATCKHDDRRVLFAPCAVCAVERRNAEQAAWLKLAGVPSILLLESFDTYVGTVEHPLTDSERANLKACRAFAEKPKGTLLMHGLTGTGKSHLCAAIIRAVGHGRYRTHEMLLSGLRAGYGNRSAAAVFEKVKASPLLVWDEFGLSVGGTDDPMMIHSILNHRHEEDLPTVIATNLSLPDFKEMVKERIESRMRQSLTNKLTFDGPDRRADMKARYLATK